MTVYAATATREGDWWVVIVPDVGATQVRRLSQASMMAADMVAAMLDVPRDTVAVAVTARVSREVDAKVKRARIAVKRASQAQRDAAACSRQVARELLESGLTGADAAEVLGVSPQRISQLVKADG